MEQRLKAISLFCGAGGLDIGFKRAGFDIVCAVDFDVDCCKTYALNHNIEALKQDISAIKGELLPESDVIVGGPPCQGFSVAGHMNPDDPRSKLIWHFIRLVLEKKPIAFVMENVKALASLGKWSAIREKIASVFEDTDYRIEMFVLNARNFGVPQSRERVFFVGTTRKLSPINTIESSSKSAVTARDVLSQLPGPGNWPNIGLCKAKITLAQKPVLRRSPYAGMLFNGQGRPINIDSVANTLPATMGGNRTPIIDEDELRLNRPSWVEIYHKRVLEGKATAMRAPKRLRRLTVEEAAALQAFPKDYCFVGSLTSRFRQIGNAVPPPLAEAVAQKLMDNIMSYGEEEKNEMGSQIQP